MGSCHRPGTAPGPADDRPSTLRTPAGDPTPITQVKVRTRANGRNRLPVSHFPNRFPVLKPVTGFPVPVNIPTYYISLCWHATATTVQYCVTYLAVTHETVYNAQACISRCGSRHLIQKKKSTPLTPGNKQENLTANCPFNLTTSCTICTSSIHHCNQL